MKRIDRKRQLKRARRRAVLAVLLCVALLFISLVIVDASTREMLGNDRSKPIFGVQSCSDGKIQLDVAGETLLIDKQKIYVFIRDIKKKLGQIARD